jgi:hypothetical protein
MTTQSNKQSILDAANVELKRIGASTDECDSFSIGLNRDGVISAGDSSGYYPAKNYRALVSDLKTFADNTITDGCYDGGDSYVWAEIWNLFQA